jgi:hypothetical protein
MDALEELTLGSMHAAKERAATRQVADEACLCRMRVARRELRHAGGDLLELPATPCRLQRDSRNPTLETTSHPSDDAALGNGIAAKHDQSTRPRDKPGMESPSGGQRNARAVRAGALGV